MSAQDSHDDAGMHIFRNHVAVYMVINAILVTINTSQPVGEDGTRTYWCIWPLLGWGIGLAAHGLALYMDRAGRTGGIMADPRLRGLAIHAFTYVCVNALLFYVDVTVTPGKWWFYWPMLGWGIGLVVHSWLVRRELRKSRAGQTASTDSG